MEKFCIFDQDGDALFAFDSISDFEIEFEKIAVNERKNGKCFAVVATDSDDYGYILAVYSTSEMASAEIIIGIKNTSTLQVNSVSSSPKLI